MQDILNYNLILIENSPIVVALRSTTHGSTVRQIVTYELEQQQQNRSVLEQKLQNKNEVNR